MTGAKLTLWVAAAGLLAATCSVVSAQVPTGTSPPVATGGLPTAPPAVLPETLSAPQPEAATLAPCPAAPAPAAPTGPRWVTPLPKPGYFATPPTGPGYYSVLDALRGDYREAPPKYPYPRVSPIMQANYDINWSYLRNPNNTEYDYADFLKWIPISDGVTFTTGGELRSRFMNEVNSNNRLSGATDAYNLWRARVYGDLWVQDWLRVFGEFLYGDVTGRSLTPLPVDINRGDILNLFADLRVFQFGEKDNPVYVRVGRQEMLYGSQRLISPLDWPNARRTFEGVKAFTRTEKWDFDVFGVRPVLVSPTNLDAADHNQFFSGAWFTYRNAPNQNIDLYYLNLENHTPGVAVGNGGVKGGYNVSTFGGRYVGSANNWMWDFEPMLQVGHYSNQSILAKAVAIDGGYNFKDYLPWSPQLWVGYEYASGDPDPQNSGTRRTFNQLFPFGHYYYGFADLVARQNINDYFLSGYVYPAKWLTVNTQFHVFRLDSNKDALYNAAGAPIRQDKTGKAGNDVGNELDLTANLHLSKHSDVLVGYSYLWAGRFIKNTAPVGPRHDAFGANPSLFYAQYSYRW